MKPIKHTKQSVKPVLIALLILFVLVPAGKLSLYIFRLNSLIDQTFPKNQFNRKTLYPNTANGIYARPFEICFGSYLLPDDLSLALSLLKYSKQDLIDSPGTYFRKGNDFTVHTRSFISGQVRKKNRKIKISFNSDGAVTSIVDICSEELLLKIELEPLKLGRVSRSRDEPHVFVPLEEVPELLIQTLIVVEDRRFYDHHGVNFNAVLKSLWINFQKGRAVRGGSTLTQQLAKNLLFTRKKAIKRKIKEVPAALLLELKLSKQEILATYINTVYLGQDGNRSINGFDAAGRFYFGRAVSDLNLSEIAMLVGMLKAPSFYNPAKNPGKAAYRRNIVLDLMERNQLISHDQALNAGNDALKTHKPGKPVRFPACTNLARRRYNRYAKTNTAALPQNVCINTTIDPVVQAKVEKGITQGLKRIETDYNVDTGDLETGVIVVSVGSCDVLAVVGGKNFEFEGFNRAVDIQRPMGSLVKPAYFLAALEKPDKYNFMTRLDNTPFTVKLGPNSTWTPKNFSPGSQGMVPLFKALSHSYNIASVRLGLDLGMEECIFAINNLGVEKPIKPYPATLLGALPMSPLEVAQMYHTLASGGYFSPVRVIESIDTGYRNGNGHDNSQTETIYSQGDKERRVNEHSIYLLNVILQKAVSCGTVPDGFKKRTAHLCAAGKTGTTDDLRDSWFAGFSGDKLAVVWMGKDNYEPGDLTGAQGAFILWDEIMSRISHVPFDPKKPENIKWVNIDPQTGFRIEEKECGQSLCLPYITGFEPRQSISCLEAGRDLKDNPPFTHWLHEILGNQQPMGE